jgi:tetratricopeptide (TPR) repeat protein
MSHQISQWLGLIGIAATIPLVQPNIAAAKTSVEIADTAKAITVLITESNSVGSGVILQRQGDIYTVLTAAHVLKNKASYKITTPDDRSYEAIGSSIRPAPGSIDLAVVRFKSTAKYLTAKLGNCNVLKSGMDLYVGGFPGASGTITESVFIFREGKVSANSNKTFENGYSLVYSNDTLPGMSGGAVLNSDGELVAIHGRGDRERLSDGQFGEKTGFNLGIPVNRFATVASNMGVELGGQVAPIPQNRTPKVDDYIASAALKFSITQDYRGSLADYNRAIQLNPKLASTYNHRGFLKADKLGDVQGAMTDFNRAIQLNPKLASAYNRRGFLKHKKFRDVQGAMTDYNRAIQLDPRLASAYNNRGFLFISLGSGGNESGLEDFDRAIQLDPDLYSAYNNRGYLKKSMSNFKGALIDYDRSIKINPNNIIAYTNRGTLKAENNDSRGALADFDRVIALDPNDAFGYGNRGALKYLKLKDRSGGIADMKQAAILFKRQGDLVTYQQTIELLKKWEANVDSSGFYQ